MRALVYYFVLILCFAVCLFQSVIYSLYAYDSITGSGDTSFSKPVIVYSSLAFVYYLVALILIVRNLYRRQQKAVMLISVAVFLLVVAQMLFESSFVIPSHIYQSGPGP